MKWFGNFSYSGYVSGLVLIFFGLFVVGHFTVEIRNSSGAVISNLSGLTNLDSGVGWLLVFLGFDSFFSSRLSGFVITRLLSPILGPFVRAVVGEERLKRFQSRRF